MDDHGILSKQTAIPLKKHGAYLIVFILILSVFVPFRPLQLVKAESSFGYTPLETVKTYDDSINSTRYFDGANHIFITPYGNFTFLQPGNIMRFTDYTGELIIEKSVFVLQYDSYGSWLPLLDFVNVQVYAVSDTTYDFRYDINYKYKGQNYVIAHVQLEFANNGLDKPKISIDMNRTQDWDVQFGDPDFRWIWDIVPYVDEIGDGWKYWKNSTEIIDITQISGTQELGNLTRLEFTDNTSISLSASLDVSDYGATIFKGGDETYWNSKGFVAVFPINVEDIDPITYTEDMVSFSAGADTTWTDHDLFTNQGVPKGSVAEILIGNSETNAENEGGVREDESALNRIVDIMEAESGGSTWVSMLVQVDSSTGLIELYAEDTSEMEFRCVGYFTGCTFSEDFQTFANTASNSWQDKDLFTDYGAPKESVVQIVSGVYTVGIGQSCGVRTDGSGLVRLVSFSEAEGGGVNPGGWVVKTDADGEIETRAQVFGEVDFYYLGYFDSGVDFTEAFTAYAPAGNGAWENEDLSGDAVAPPANSIVYFSVVHDNDLAETECGVRSIGSGLDRKLDVREAEPALHVGFGCAVNVDDNKMCEVYCETASEADFYYLGFFSEIAGGEEYSRTTTQGITWAGSLSRTWSPLRVISQSLTFAWTGIKGTWSTSRLASLSLSPTFTGLRDWTLLRVFSQSFSFTWDALGQITAGAESHYRTVTLSVSTAWNTIRSWILLRSFTQSMTFTWNGLREWTLLRTLTQTFTFTWNALYEMNFLRQLTLSLTTTFNTLRDWTLLREITQSLSTSFNMLRTWTLTRAITQGFTFAWEAIGIHGVASIISRTVTLSLTSTFNAIKGAWSLTRVITQPITMTFNALREWSLLRSFTQSFTFTWNGYGSKFIEYLFDLKITDSLLPLSNAIVQIFRGSSTIWSGQTFTNGSIATQTLPEGNYSLYVELDGFIPYENLLNLNTNIIWDVALTAITFNMVFFGFFVLACASMYIGWKQDKPTDSLWAYFFSVILWVGTMYQWVIDNGSANSAMLWVFMFPLSVLVFFIYEEATQFYEESLSYKKDAFI